MPGAPSGEQLLTKAQVRVLCTVAEHGPAEAARSTAAPESEGAAPTVTSSVADRLLASGHLMRFGTTEAGRQIVALTDLGWQVASKAGVARAKSDAAATLEEQRGLEVVVELEPGATTDRTLIVCPICGKRLGVLAGLTADEIVAALAEVGHPDRCGAEATDA